MIYFKLTPGKIAGNSISNIVMLININLLNESQR